MDKILQDILEKHNIPIRHTGVQLAMEEYGRIMYNKGLEEACVFGEVRIGDLGWDGHNNPIIDTLSILKHRL